MKNYLNHGFRTVAEKSEGICWSAAAAAGLIPRPVIEQQFTFSVKAAERFLLLLLTLELKVK